METDHQKLEFIDRELYNIAIETIEQDKNQPRKHFDKDSLTELAHSIQQHGVIEPVIFRVEKNKLILISGERRWRAAKLAKLETIPAIYREGAYAEIALVENLLREDLTPVEEAEAMQRMVDEHNYTQVSLANALGKGRSTVAEILSLNRLPLEIKEDCRANPKVSRRVLVEIAKQKKTPKGMLSLYRKFKNKGLTGDDVRKITRPRRDKAVQTKAKIDTINEQLNKLATSKEWNDTLKEKTKASIEALLKTLNSLLTK